MIATNRKRVISLLMAVFMCLLTVFSVGATTAYAAGESADVYMIAFPRDGDENLDYSGSWGHGSLTYMNGWSSGTSVYTTVRTVGSSNGQIC